MSPNSQSNKKSLRFNGKNPSSGDLDDLERQISHDLGTFKINYGTEEPMINKNAYIGSLTSTGAETALMN